MERELFLNVDLLKCVNVSIMRKNTELGKMYWYIIYGFNLGQQGKTIIFSGFRKSKVFIPSLEWLTQCHK